MTANAQPRDDGVDHDPHEASHHQTPHPSAALTLTGSRAAGLIAPGAVLNKTYRVERRLAEGGMGDVYLATHLTLGRSVAVKVIRPAAGNDDLAVQRFLREARILSQFNHPNIVTVLDFGMTDPEPTYYLVLEYLHGETLQEYVGRCRPVPLAVVLDVMREICAGIGAAHQHKVIHRDLKPANLFLVARTGRSPQVKILDFGLAKPFEQPVGDNPLTTVGMVVGTCGYTAPEQFQGKAADVRSDVYGLGGILYYLVAGVPPYHGETSHSIVIKQATEAPPAIDFARLGIPEAAGLRVVLNKALHRDPELRYQTAAELLVALETVLAPLTQSAADIGLPGGSQTLSSAAMRTWSSGLTTPSVSIPDIDSIPKNAVPAEGGIPGPGGRTASVAVPSAEPRRSSLLPALGGALAGMAVLCGIVAVAVWSLKQPDQHRDDGRNVPAAAAPVETPRLPTGRSEHASAAPGVTDAEVLFGMSGPFSGPSKELGRSMALGIDACFSRVNADGGVHGRKLRLVSADDGYEPDRAKARVRSLLEQEKVFGFVGNVGTPTTAAALPLILEQNRVLFGPYTGAGVVRKDPPDRFVFNFRASYAEETAAIVDHLVVVRKIRPEQIAVFAQDDSYGDAGFAGVRKALRKHGIDQARILRVGYARNSGDTAEAAATLLKNRERVAAVVMVATYQPAARLIKAVRDGGLSPVFTNVSFVGAAALAEALAGFGPAYADGVIVTQVVPDVRSGASGVRRFREDLKRFHPSETPDSVGLEGYVAAEVLVEGVRRAGPGLTPDALVDALEKITDLDLGIGAIVSYGPSRHQASHKVWGTVLTAGEYVPLELD